MSLRGRKAEKLLDQVLKLGLLLSATKDTDEPFPCKFLPAPYETEGHRSLL